MHHSFGSPCLFFVDIALAPINSMIHISVCNLLTLLHLLEPLLFAFVNHSEC
jgi:hypothetical protein